jgi:hypothetical protein
MVLPIRPHLLSSVSQPSNRGTNAGPTLWVPPISVTSRDLHVLVRETAESISSQRLNDRAG